MSSFELKPATERVIWLLLALASAVPFWVAPLPILPDLFTHIGRYHVMNHLNDAWLSRYYAFDWHITGNLGVDLLMVWLGPVLGTEKAAYLIAALIPPIVVLGIYRLARAARPCSSAGLFRHFADLVLHLSSWLCKLLARGWPCPPHRGQLGPDALYLYLASERLRLCLSAAHLALPYFGLGDIGFVDRGHGVCA
jgi:hypothetical protein